MSTDVYRKCIFTAAANRMRVYGTVKRAHMCKIHHHLRVGGVISKARLAVVVLGVVGRVKCLNNSFTVPGR